MPPAARETDMHVCPQVTVLVPHVGGPILPPCCPTVLIGFLAAARVSDMLTCVGPPDTIVMGSPTVMIGNLMAARIGDPTAHGGVIILGCFTVMIGDVGAPGILGPVGLPIVRLPNGDLQVGTNIVISGDAAFQARALTDLNAVAKTKTGKSIFDALGKGTHKVTIKSLDMATAKKNGALAGPVDPAGSKNPKKGSDTTISYNPDVKLQMTDQDGNKIDYPVQSMLGHEMIHAVHNSNGGNLKDNPDPKDPTGNQEESQTIGINDHAGEPMTENNLLDDMGAGFQRTDHDLSATTD